MNTLIYITFLWAFIFNMYCPTSKEGVGKIAKKLKRPQGGGKFVIIGTPCFTVLSITFLPSLVFFVVLISANVCSHVKRA